MAAQAAQAAPPGKLVYAIEGNIGIGKTTLIRYMLEKLGPDVVYICEEPVPGDLLDAFYANPDSEDAAFALQMHMLKHRFTALMKALAEDAPIIIMDRGFYGDAAFFKMREWTPEHTTQYIKKNEQHWAVVQLLINAHILDVYTTLFLASTPSFLTDVARSRIAARGRPCERSIGAPYLWQYERILSDLLTRAKQTFRPVHTIALWDGQPVEELFARVCYYVPRTSGVLVNADE